MEKHSNFELLFIIDDGKLGRKRDGGLYPLIKYENGLKRKTVYDIDTRLYRDEIPYAFPFAEKMKHLFSEGDYQKAIECLIENHSLEAEICRSFLLKYIIYSLYTAVKVSYSVEAADDAMANGFNWCPPLAMYDALSAVADVTVLVKERHSELCERIDVEYYLKKAKPSKYDFRPFFKSGK